MSAMWMEKREWGSGTFAQLSSHYLSIFTDVIEELPSGDVLHHHEDVSWGANNLIPADTDKAKWCK